ncbi:hypothetical protein ACT3N0_12040 [Citrobacter portucalensis]|uniref:hypothetical protein n=1 Tax=Citrobacter portucalensis TaxID=1639133 RepID=UPI004033489B
MQQNNQLTNDRLAHVYRNLKRWAEHDNALNSYISGQKIDPIFHDCVVALAELQERRKVDGSVPIAWTDAEELRDLERDGYAAMLSIKNKDKNTDPRRQIFLYTAPQLAPNLLDAIDEIVDEILAVDTIASTAALKTIFRMKTGKMRLDLACQQHWHKQQQLEAK